MSKKTMMNKYIQIPHRSPRRVWEDFNWWLFLFSDCHFLITWVNVRKLEPCQYSFAIIQKVMQELRNRTNGLTSVQRQRTQIKCFNFMLWIIPYNTAMESFLTFAWWALFHESSVSKCPTAPGFSHLPGGEEILLSI